MVSFDGFSITSGIPIYQQILLFIKRGIIAGTVLDGQELPSRRTLSALLGVNPNTVQKAYHMLEEEGLIQSRSGAKSEIVLTPEKTASVRRQVLINDARNIAAALKQMGLSKEESLELLSSHWD